MLNDQFSAVFAPPPAIVNSMVTANKRAVADFEKLINFQSNIVQFYLDLGLARMKTAAEIDNAEALRAFYAGQMEAAYTVAQRLMDDTQALANLHSTFKADFDDLAQTTAAEFASTAPVAAAESKERVRKSA